VADLYFIGQVVKDDLPIPLKAFLAHGLLRCSGLVRTWVQFAFGRMRLEQILILFNGYRRLLFGIRSFSGIIRFWLNEFEIQTDRQVGLFLLNGRLIFFF